MRHRDMYSQPGYLIRRVHQRSTAEFAGAVKGAGVTQVQLSIMLAVIDYPGIDATRISELIGSDRTTIGQALSLLESKGLIERQTGTLDKRTKRLVITKAGQELADTIGAAVPGVGDAILKGLDSDERETFLRILAKIVAANEGPAAVGEPQLEK